MFLINGKILNYRLTGVQRYLLDISNRWSDFEIAKPEKALDGTVGHMWEQFILPAKTRGRVLFSPSNSGPLAVKRQVVTVHDVVAIDHPEWFGKKFSLWYSYLIPRLCRSVDSIITISDFTKSRIMSLGGVDESKITVVKNGVDQKFQPANFSSIEQAKAVQGLNGRRYVLSVGSLEPRKNLARLIKCWRIIKDEIDDDVDLVIVGAKGKSLIFNDVDMTDLPERVRLTGHLPDDQLIALYSGALCFVYLSEYEGFGLPPLEAMACGTVPITGNLTALPEVMGDAGVMVNPFSDDEICHAMINVVSNDLLRSSLQVECIAQAKKFNWDAAARQTLAVINSV